MTAGFDAGTVTLNLYRGAMIGCYTCHNGPDNDSINNSPHPTVTSVSGNTLNNSPLNLTVTVTPSTATLRIITQPANGSLGVTNHAFRYFPNPGFVGTDTFTYAAWDGSNNSDLTAGTVTVSQGASSLGAIAYVPPTYPAGWPAAFAVVPVLTNLVSTPVFDWDFGDGTPHSTNQFPVHRYSAGGYYSWSVVTTAASLRTESRGLIAIDNPIVLGIALTSNSAAISWPNTIADTVLETSTTLASPSPWLWVTNVPVLHGGQLTVTLPAAGNQFYRVRQPW